jgi:hypothetical protein
VSLETLHYLGVQHGVFATTTRQDLDGLLGAAAATPSTVPLVVHFPAGLTDRAGELQAAERLLPAYLSAGGYPVFVLGEAGLLGAVRRRLSDIFDERVLQRLIERVAQLAVARLDPATASRLPRVQSELRSGGEPFAALTVATGPAPLDDAEREALARELAADKELRGEARAIVNWAERRAGGAHPSYDRRRATLMSRAVLEDAILEAHAAEATGGEPTGWLARRATAALEGVLARFASDSDHGLYPTVVEELLRALYQDQAGGLAWANRKKDSADAFGGDPDRHPGTAFVEGLRMLHADAPRRRIVLVAHGAGAIDVCNLLGRADGLPATATFELVLLAPACDLASLDGVLDERVDGLRVFMLSDELERADRLLGARYPRSLLYFVSGVLEDQPDARIAGMERFQAPVDRVRTPTDADTPPGMRSAATRHADFELDAATLESLAHVVTHGLAPRQ